MDVARRPRGTKDQGPRHPGACEGPLGSRRAARALPMVASRHGEPLGRPARSAADGRAFPDDHPPRRRPPRLSLRGHRLRPSGGARTLRAIARAACVTRGPSSGGHAPVHPRPYNRPARAAGARTPSAPRAPERSPLRALRLSRQVRRIVAWPRSAVPARPLGGRECRARRVPRRGRRGRARLSAAGCGRRDDPPLTRVSSISVVCRRRIAVSSESRASALPDSGG
jgi:hypothetical protein